MSRYNNPTSRLYQAGFELDDAVAKGADPILFCSLEKEFDGASIPPHLIFGFKKPRAYSCEYHTGGAAGQMLRNYAKMTRSN